MKKYKNKIAVLIPAYNEEERIGAVLDVVTQIPIIDEIIVVNDGSRDNTAKVVRGYSVTLINCRRNKGKAAALKSGIKSVNAHILITLDSDLVSFRKEHFLNLLAPIISDKLDMAVGIFVEGRNSTDRAHRIAPELSG
jgi:glycosyltransferase involved in cell wall biosynthesis